MGSTGLDEQLTEWIEAALTALINKRSRPPGLKMMITPFILVLDDYHVSRKRPSTTD